MGKFKIEKGASRIARVKLQATIEESIAADLSLMCEWSNNDKNYVVNELLRFAVSEDSEFQAYKQSLASARPEPKEAGDTPSSGSRSISSSNSRMATTKPGSGGRRWESEHGARSEIAIENAFESFRPKSVSAFGWTECRQRLGCQIDSDALLRYAAFERPAMYQAFIVSYAPFLFTTPFLLLSMCLSLVYIHFYQEQIQQAAGLYAALSQT